jgi:hypothetical protein
MSLSYTNKGAAVQMIACRHPQVTLLNPYELVRKYRCDDCREVMMCSCEEEFGKRFLPHQLNRGVELKTQRRVPVTLGFLGSVCPECRGLPPKAYPSAERFGRTTKIQRYYWREIFFETVWRVQAIIDAGGEISLATNEIDQSERWHNVSREVVEHFKAIHSESPKFSFEEKSQSSVLEEASVHVTNLKATFLKTKEKKAQLLYGDEICTAEEYASRSLAEQGYSVIFTESVPFHVIFSVLLHGLIQDPSDPQVESHGFGNKEAFERREQGEMIWALLPSDFGTSAYAERRQTEIDRYFELLPQTTTDLLELFDDSLESSWSLRQYLWAHRAEYIETARRILEVLDLQAIYRIVRYLVGDYWRRYLGWPDLLAWNDSDYFFAEVKASRDKLRQDQMSWIRSNKDELGLPFRVIKIHRQGTLEM